MTTVALSELFDFYRLPVGRRVHAMRKTRELVASDAHVAQLADASLAHDTSLLESQTHWGEAKNVKTTWSPRVMALNVEHDRIWGSLQKVVAGMSSALPESPAGQAASRVATAVFSEGLVPLTKKDFVQQRETTDAWLKRLTNDFADDMTLLGLAPIVKRLAQVNTEFGQLIDQVKTQRGVDYADLLATDAEGQEMLLRVVAAITGKWTGAKAGEDDKRTAWLAPILEQNAALAELHRRNARVTDVDPATGEVVEQPVAPTPA